jgi:hypothetical protein
MPSEWTQQKLQFKEGGRPLIDGHSDGCTKSRCILRICCLKFTASGIAAKWVVEDMAALTHSFGSDDILPDEMGHQALGASTVVSVDITIAANDDVDMRLKVDIEWQWNGLV